MRISKVENEYHLQPLRDIARNKQNIIHLPPVNAEMLN